jgi:hypothetical protein
MGSSEKVHRLAHLWGMSGLALFLIGAIVLLVISIIENNVTSRSLLVVSGFGAIGLLAYGVARLTGHLLVRIAEKG